MKTPGFTESEYKNTCNIIRVTLQDAMDSFNARRYEKASIQAGVALSNLGLLKHCKDPSEKHDDTLNAEVKCDSCGFTKLVNMSPNGSFCMETFWSHENSLCDKCCRKTMNPVTVSQEEMDRHMNMEENK